MAPDLMPVDLPPGSTVHGAKVPQRYLYFITDGIVSRFYVTADGASTELAISGNEGVIGVASFLGGGSTLSQVVVVSAGHAYRLRAAVLSHEFEHEGPLADLLVAVRHICSLQFVRTLTKVLSCQFAGRRYQIQTGGAPRYALHGKKITVCQGADGTVTLLNGAEQLPYLVFDRHAHLVQSRVADDKTLNAKVDAALARVHRSGCKQPPNHPWKRAIKPKTVPSAVRSGSP